MAQLAIDGNGKAIQAMAVKTSEDVDGTAASAQSGEIDSDIVRIAAQDDVRVEFGSDPEATDTSCFIPYGSVEYFLIAKGSKVAIKGGVANICAMV